MITLKSLKYHASLTVLALVPLGIFIFMVIGLLDAIAKSPKQLGSSEAASWMQAIGAFGAIAGSFLLAEIQQVKERKRTEEQRANERKSKLDAILEARTLAVKNLVQVAGYAVVSAETLVSKFKQGCDPGWAADAYFAHTAQLREVLDSLITSETDHVAVLAALEISRTITLLNFDLKNTGGAMTVELVERSNNNVQDARKLLDTLIEIQNDMLRRCHARGIPSSSRDFEV